MTNEPKNDREHERDDPIQTAIFLAIIISGFLLIHFFAFRIW